MSTKISKQDRLEAIERLLGFIKPGDTVYTTLRHVSASGMLRVIDLHVIQDNAPRWIGWTAATAMLDKYDDRKQGIRAGGCGQDMGFALVYNLGRTLWPLGYVCSGENCRSNDHSNGHGERQQHSTNFRSCDRAKPCDHADHGAVAGYHRDGGYALKHEWL